MNKLTAFGAWVASLMAAIKGGRIMGKVIEAIKLAWKYRKSFAQFKVEILEASAKIKEAKADGKITKAELVDILKEVDDVLDLVIEVLSEDK